MSGEIVRGELDDDSKIASSAITITAEMTLSDLIRHAAAWMRDHGHAAATGCGGHAMAAGDWGHAAATGNCAHAAAVGNWGHAAATGCNGHAVAAGDRGHAVATGYNGHAMAAGDRGHAAATGCGGIAASLGPRGTATAGSAGWIVLAAWRWNDRTDEYELLHVKAAQVGGPEGIRAGVTYRLDEDGAFVEASDE